MKGAAASTDAEPVLAPENRADAASAAASSIENSEEPTPPTVTSADQPQPEVVIDVKL